MSNLDTELTNNPTFFMLQVANTNKVTSIQSKNAYFDLDNFRRQLNQQGNMLQQLYSFHKRKASSYRLTFAGMGLLFVVLMLIVSFKTSLFFGFMYSTYSSLLKTGIMSACGMLSLAAFALAFRVQAEKDAIHQLLFNAKRRIKQLYARKCSGFGLKRFFDFEQTAHLKHAYYEVTDLMHELKDNAQYTIKEINRSEDLEAGERENLLNQTILEFRDKLNAIIKAY